MGVTGEKNDAVKGCAQKGKPEFPKSRDKQDQREGKVQASCPRDTASPSATLPVPGRQRIVASLCFFFWPHGDAPIASGGKGLKPERSRLQPKKQGGKGYRCWVKKLRMTVGDTYFRNEHLPLEKILGKSWRRTN